MLVELRAKHHGVDRHGAGRRRREQRPLEESAGPVGTDVEFTVALAHYADGVADRVLDVFVGNTVLAGVVGDLHLCRLTCPSATAQVTLRTPCTLDHIGTGRRHTGTNVLIVVHDLHMGVLTTDGQLL